MSLAVTVIVTSELSEVPFWGDIEHHVRLLGIDADQSPDDDAIIVIDPPSTGNSAEAVFGDVCSM